MAKGSYNVSVSGDSNLDEGHNNNNEAEFEKQECMNSCLSPLFLRSLSFHDRPQSSRASVNKELHKDQYTALVSSSLENIPSNPLSPSKETSEYNAYHGFESIGASAEVEMTTPSTFYDSSSSFAYQQIDQNRMSGSDNWLEQGYTKFDRETDKLLKKAIDVLRRLDKDIAESLTNVSKPESIAVESVIEVYKHKSESTKHCSEVSEYDLSKELPSQPIYENWPPSIHQTLKDTEVHSTPQRLNGLQAQSPRQIPKDLQAESPLQSLKKLNAHCAQRSPRNLSHCNEQSPKNFQVQPQQNPKNFLVHSAEQTLKNLQSLLSSDSGNMQSSTKPHPVHPQSVEQNAKNVLSSPKIRAPDDTTGGKSSFEFDLPSDHEQFIKIIGALQNRCLEYREMIQDITVLALQECLNFSKISVTRVRHLRKQFENQKKNFRDFKELCCKSVVFGPDSLPIDEKVTEVIQSFYLKLLQEENETFFICLEFGLKMGEMYTKMLKFETENKKTITTLEKEILYLKKTSVGFKV